MPDRSPTNVLVYIVPAITGGGALEIRCHLTTEDPDPANDQLLGSVTIPPELLNSPPPDEVDS